MNLFRASAISTAVLIGASFLPRIDVAHAQLRPSEAPHAEDGVYAVYITTLQGDCNSAYHWTGPDFHTIRFVNEIRACRK